MKKLKMKHKKFAKYSLVNKQSVQDTNPNPNPTTKLTSKSGGLRTKSIVRENLYSFGCI